jgi:hypothetical protein
VWPREGEEEEDAIKIEEAHKKGVAAFMLP